MLTRIRYIFEENKRKYIRNIREEEKESSWLGRNRYSTPLCNESQAATMKKTNVPGHKEPWFSVSLKIETTVTPAPLIYPFLINQNKYISCLTLEMNLTWNLIKILFLKREKKNNNWKITNEIWQTKFANHKLLLNIYFNIPVLRPSMLLLASYKSMSISFPSFKIILEMVL